jgi:hypothetical protein
MRGGVISLAVRSRKNDRPFLRLVVSAGQSPKNGAAVENCASVRRRLFHMAVAVEMQNTGDVEQQRDVVAIVEHVLSDRTGDWRVSIIGSQDSDQWELKVFGPNGFERSYTLEGTAGQHDPHVIAAIVSRMVPSRT